LLAKLKNQKAAKKSQVKKLNLLNEELFKNSKSFALLKRKIALEKHHKNILGWFFDLWKRNSDKPVKTESDLTGSQTFDPFF